MFASSVVDRGFESGHVKTIKMIFVVSPLTLYVSLMRKSRLWIRNHWSRIITNSTKRGGLVQRGHHHHYLIEFNWYSPWYRWKIVHLALKNNHSSITRGHQNIRPNRFFEITSDTNSSVSEGSWNTAYLTL